MGRCVLASWSFTSATCNLSRARRIFHRFGLVRVIVLVSPTAIYIPSARIDCEARKRWRWLSQGHWWRPKEFQELWYSDSIGFLFVYMCPLWPFVIGVVLVLGSLVQVCKLMHQMCPRHHQRSWLSTGWAGTGNFQSRIWLQRTCENGLWAPWLSRWETW